MRRIELDDVKQVIRTLDTVRYLLTLPDDDSFKKDFTNKVLNDVVESTFILLNACREKHE